MLGVFGVASAYVVVVLLDLVFGVIDGKGRVWQGARVDLCD